MASHQNLRRPSRRYANVAIFLHWILAALIVLSIALGMAHAPFALHQSVVLAVLLLSFLRLAWRLAHPLLPLPTVMVGWEKAMARSTHVAFYLAMIGIPLVCYLTMPQSYGPYAMTALLVLHVGAALKHSYIQRTLALAPQPTLPAIAENAAH